MGKADRQVQGTIARRVRMDNRRVHVVRAIEADIFILEFVKYDPSIKGRKRDRVVRSRIALSSEAMTAVVQCYLSMGNRKDRVLLMEGNQ